MIFTSENDVRLWMRLGLGELVRWVEPSAGSTIGLPDCFAPSPARRQTWVELKLGIIAKGRLKYKVRPAQKKQIAMMLKDGLIVGLIVGVKGTNQAWAMVASEETLSGEVDVKGGVNGGWLLELNPVEAVGPQQGVFSIFLYTMAGEHG